MSFAGGGSDMPAFYREEVGAVISTTINKFIYVSVNRNFDNQIRLSYSKTEQVNAISAIEHPLAREALGIMSITGGVEITSIADIPSRGSGLGSSSSYTVGLLNVLTVYKNQQATKEILARTACEIEIDKCGKPIGKQDQYAASYGGFNLITFNPDESVIVEPVQCKPQIIRSIAESILVFYTGRTRNASAILQKQAAVLKDKEKHKTMRRMVELAFQLKKEIEAGNVENFGEILHENWCIKSGLVEGIADDQIDLWYRSGIGAGATGGKLLGAGSGGFLMFFAEPGKHKSIKEALRQLKEVKLEFVLHGTEIIFNDETQ